MYDVIIVGGGIAGCYTASLLPKGLDILLLEKHKSVKPKDSGIVSRHFSSFISAPSLVKHRASEIECVSPSGKIFRLHSPEPFVSILRRRRLTRYLRQQAKTRATIRYENVTRIIHRKDCVTVETPAGSYDGRMVVGCDGANSQVRQSLGIKSPVLSVGMMVKTKEPMADAIRVFFNKYYSPDFFSWIIPQNKEYGLITAIRPREYLQYFARKEGLPQGELFAYLVPLGMTRSYGNRALLIGDACGQNKPLTGGGIVFSLRASRIAAHVISEACASQSFRGTYLSEYQRLWHAELRREIWRQELVRRIYRRLTNAEIDELFSDFGPSMEMLYNFDYDRFSLSWRQLPLRKLASFAIRKARYAL